MYGAWWFSLLWAVLTAAGVVYFLRHRCKSWSGIAIHLSFVVILAGAFVTHVSSERGTVHLRQTTVPVFEFLSQEEVDELGVYSDTEAAD